MNIYLILPHVYISCKKVVRRTLSAFETFRITLKDGKYVSEVDGDSPKFKCHKVFSNAIKQVETLCI